MNDIPRDPQWQAAVDQLYDAVGREQRLAQALGAFRPFFQAPAVSFFTAPDARHPSSSHTGAVGMNDQMLVEYHAHYSVHDEWVNAALKRSDFGAGAVYRGTELVERRQLQQSYFGRQFLSRHGVVDILGTIVEAGDVDGPMSWAAFHRHRGQPMFSKSDALAIAALAPHLRQVLRLHRRLAPRLAVGSTLREVMQRLETPLLFVAADGRIVDSNATAQTALASATGWLRERAGRLVVCEGGRWQELSTWLPALRNGASESLLLDLANDERRCATLEIFPIQAAMLDTVANHEAVAICCLRPGPRDRVQALRALHGLTATEARVALQLAEGATVSGIASTMCVAISTVRSHIAAVRGKLGVSRQGQIVSAVLAL